MAAIPLAVALTPGNHGWRASNSRTPDTNGMVSSHRRSWWQNSEVDAALLERALEPGGRPHTRAPRRYCAFAKRWIRALLRAATRPAGYPQPGGGPSPSGGVVANSCPGPEGTPAARVDRLGEGEHTADLGGAGSRRRRSHAPSPRRSRGKRGVDRSASGGTPPQAAPREGRPGPIRGASPRDEEEVGLTLALALEGQSEERHTS